MKLKLRRLIEVNDGHHHKFTYDKTIIKQEFPGVHAKCKGSIRLEAILDCAKERDHFKASLPKECHGQTSPELNCLMTLPIPSV